MSDNIYYVNLNLCSIFLPFPLSPWILQTVYYFVDTIHPIRIETPIPSLEGFAPAV